jgi:hypothetical protein
VFGIVLITYRRTSVVLFVIVDVCVFCVFLCLVGHLFYGCPIFFLDFFCDMLYLCIKD